MVIMNRSICAIIPIKHLSTRVPEKNYRDFNGKPLFRIILDTLLSFDELDRIVIDTNSPIVKNTVIAEYDDSRITVYDRPEHLWAGDIPTNLLFENLIADLDLNYDLFIQTHVTNPLLTLNTIRKSIEYFVQKQKEGHDSLFSVKKHQTRLYTLKDNEVLALNHNPSELLPTQDLEPLYEENSCIYIFTRETLFKKHHRIGYDPVIYVMDDIESIDIDIETDFLIAEILYRNLNKINTNTVVNNNDRQYVLITGVVGGIGQSLAKTFKRHDWYVIGVDIKPDTNSEHIDRFIRVDLTEQNAIKNIIKSIQDTEQRLDCIINNAAIQICKPIWELAEDEWIKTYNCNVMNIYLTAKYGLELLKKSDNPNIINIASVHATNTSCDIAAYASSKAAVVGLTKNMAIELGKYNVRVNAISPGAIDTPMLRDGLRRGYVENTYDEEDDIESILIDKISEKHILKYIGKPYNIAEFAHYITTNNYITGSNLIVDGGATIKLSTE